MSVFNRLQISRNKHGGTNLKVGVQIICEQRKHKKPELLYAICIQQFKIFSASFVNFCIRVLLNSLTSPDHRNHDTLHPVANQIRSVLDIMHSISVDNLVLFSLFPVAQYIVVIVFFN